MENHDVKVSKAQQKAVNKYVRNNYDRINVTLPKGRRDQLKEHARAKNESVNGFILRAIDETISRDLAMKEGEPHDSTPE